MTDSLFTPGNRTRVKICGLTAYRDASIALEAGADFLGFVFYEKSPRYIAPKQAADLLGRLRAEFPPERIRPVGVFVNAPAEEVWAMTSYLQLAAVQIHGDETIEYLASIHEATHVIRAIRVKDESSLAGLEDAQLFTAAFLFDAHASSGFGGTGGGFPHHLAEPWIARHPILIAGGLRPDTVGDVVRRLHPFGVDVSSGVETSPGIKDPKKIEAFLNAVRQADRAAFEADFADIDVHDPEDHRA